MGSEQVELLGMSGPIKDSDAHSGDIAIAVLGPGCLLVAEA